MGLGVFSRRGKSPALWRGTGKTSSRKKERGLPELLTGACGQPGRGTTRLTLAGFLATRAWGVPFFLRQHLLWGLTVPGSGDSPPQGRTRHESGKPDCGGGSPFHGRRGGHRPEKSQPWKEKRGQEKKKVKKEKKRAAPKNLFGVLETGIKLLLITQNNY